MVVNVVDHWQEINHVRGPRERDPQAEVECIPDRCGSGRYQASSSLWVFGSERGHPAFDVSIGVVIHLHGGRKFGECSWARVCGGVYGCCPMWGVEPWKL